MRASDLLGHEVVDADGESVGRVHDLRCREPRDDIGATDRLRVVSLVIGPGAIGSRLGYAHGDVHGPWLLERLVSILARHARIVPVDGVEAWGPPVVLRVRKADLRHPREAP